MATSALVERDLIGRSTPRPGPRDELTQLGMHVLGGDNAVADRHQQVVAACREGSQCGLKPTDVTCTPGVSHERRTTGSTAWVRRGGDVGAVERLRVIEPR